MTTSWPSPCRSVWSGGCAGPGRLEVSGQVIDPDTGQLPAARGADEATRSRGQSRAVARPACRAARTSHSRGGISQDGTAGSVPQQMRGSSTVLRAEPTYGRSRPVPILAHPDSVFLGMDVHKDSISAGILNPGRESPDVEKIFNDEASVRRLIGRFGDGWCGLVMRRVRLAMTCTDC